MRYIDVYRTYSSSPGVYLIAQDCIQTGSADIVRKPNAKSFIMADGSFCVYTADNDAVEMTLSLECTELQARAVAGGIRQGFLYFAGMRAGTYTTPTPSDSDYFSARKTAFTGYLTENASVRIQQISSDLFSMQIPLKLKVSSGNIFYSDIPVIQIAGLSILGTEENLSSGYVYQKDSFRRKRIIFTDADTAAFHFSYTNGISGVSATVIKNGNNILNWNTVSEENTGELPLSVGKNEFIFRVDPPNSAYKRLIFRFTVYRQPGTL